MTYYKKITTIQNCLYDNDVPTDLHSIIFSFYGDLDESIDDLTNKHCFCKINCSSFIQQLRGYYCKLCNVFLEVKTTRQLQRHINSVSHRHHLHNDTDLNEPSLQEIRQCCCEKWFRNMPRISKKYKQKFMDDLTPECIIINISR